LNPSPEFHVLRVSRRLGKLFDSPQPRNKRAIYSACLVSATLLLAGTITVLFEQPQWNGKSGGKISSGKVLPQLPAPATYPNNNIPFNINAHPAQQSGTTIDLSSTAGTQTQSGPLRISFGPVTQGKPATSSTTKVTQSSTSPTISPVNTASPLTAAQRFSLSKYGNLPMSFEFNAGQKPSPVNFVARGGGYTLELAPTSAHLSLFIQDPVVKDRKSSRDPLAAPAEHPTDLNLQFIGANSSAKSEGLIPLPGKSNYFLTSDPKTWFTNIPTYSQVAFHDLYPGVDLVYYGNQSHLEYDFLVAPGANPDLIQLQLQGAQTQTLAADGSILAQLDGTEVHLRKPVIYQLDDSGKKEFVEGNYLLESANLPGGSDVKITFQIGAYDAKRLLIIDPVLSYSTYQNGWPGQIDALAVDSSGDLYIASYASGVGITKISPDGSTALFTTTLGTSTFAYPTSIALGSTGKIYFTGTTNSTSWPTTTNAFQQTNGGGYDTFVSVLDATGSSLLYSTYLGGTTTENNSSIAVDASGKIYVNGLTGSSNFPTTTGAFQTTLTSSYAQYVAKIDPTLSGTASLIYSTLLNNANYASYVQGPSIAVDSTGNTYFLSQGTANFPVTTGAYRFDGTGSPSGGIFISKLNPTATQLIYSAYLAPGNPFGLALDGAGSVYVTGTSTYSDFPTTSGAYQTSYPGAFVSKLSADGSSLVYSTFLSGPSQNANPTNIGIIPGCASNCSVYISGYTTASDFPTVNPIQNFLAGYRNLFITQLSGDGSAATFSSYFGGSSYDANGTSYVYDPLIAIDPSGNIYFGGYTGSNDLPVTMVSSYANQFIAKISPTNASTVFTVPNSLTFSYEPIGVPSASQTFKLRNLGSATLTISSIQITGDFSETNTCGGSVVGGGSCTVTVIFTPTLAGARFGTVTINSSGNNTPSIVSLQGTGQDTPLVQILPATVTFPSTAVGSASASQTLTVSNIGNQPLTIYSIYMYDTLNFSQTNNCPQSLSPGLTCSVSVVFNPSQPTYLSTTLYASASSPGGPNQSTTLIGSGILSTNKAAGTLSASSINFGTLAIGNTTTSAYVYLTSTGSAPLTVTGATITPGDFAFNYYSCNTATSYAPGSYCQFSINFKPTAAGVRTATLTINDDGVGSPHTVSLTGTGVLSTSTLVISSTSLTFTSQVVGTVSPSQFVTIFNTGTAPLTISRMEGTLDFPVSSNYCTNGIAVGSYCSFYVYFAPQAAGTRNGAITIVDSATGSPHTILVTGTGVSVATGLVPNSTSLVFDPQVINTSSPIQTLYINNSSNIPVSVSTAVVSGDYSLTYDGCTGANITVNSNCQLNVVFTPIATGTRAGTITINSNAAGSPYSISLTGTGLAVASSLVPSATALDFGPFVVGTTTAVQTVTFSNTGDVPVTIGTATLSGDFAFQYDGCSGLSVLVGNSCYVNVTFTPTVAGARPGSISLPASDSGTPHAVSLTGTGVTVGSEFVPSVSGIVFGPQPVNTTSASSQTITFTNTGNVPVSVTTDVVTGDFALSYDGCTNTAIVVGSYCYFNVTFTPTAAGVRSGKVVVNSSDTGGPHTITFSGNGLAATKTLLFTPSSMDFGSIATSATSVATYIYVRNTGTEDVLLSAAITVTGDFAISGNACGGNGNTITAGNSCYLTLTFTPTTIGTRTGTLTFTDSATGSPQTVSLTGVGVSTTPVFSFMPNYVAFDAYPVGTPSPITYITLAWGGTGAVTVSNILPSGDFSIANFGSCGSATPSGTAPFSCYVALTFNPSVAGARTGTLTVTDNVAGSPHKASLFGYGLTSSNSVYITPSGLNFIDQPVGITAPQLFVTLTNIGNVPLNITNTTVTGDFAITSYYYNCGGAYYTSLPPNGSCQLYVTFTPTTTGNRTGNLTITDSSSTSPHVIPLTGKGLAVDTTIEVTPAAVAFVDQPQNTTSASTQLVTVTNKGNVSVTFSSVTISGDFAITSYYYNCGGAYYTSLAPNGSCPIYMTFTPTATGLRTGTLTITDSSTTSPHHVALTGKGIPNITTALVTPNGLDFLDTPQNTTNAQQLAVTLTNTGNVSLNITSAATSGDFAITNYYYNCGGAYYTSLPPNGTCPVYLSFTPTATGIRTGTLTITDSATNSPQLVTLKGKGITSVTTASITPTVMPFQDLPVNATSGLQSVTFTNTGNIPLNNIATSLTAGDFSINTNYSNCGAPAYTTLAPGSYCTVYLTFTPTTTGTRTATLTITSSATNSPQTVSLTGKGVTATATGVLSPGSLNFGAETVGVTTTYSYVTYTNTGNITLALSAFNITGDFSLYSNGCSTTLAPATTCNVYLQFTPSTSGSRTGVFSITDNATGSPHTVALNGTGITTAQAIQLSQTSVTFGNTVIGKTTPPMLVYQYNQGATNVQISNLAITGDFSFTGSSCYATITLSQGTSCYYNLTFTPTAAGLRSGTLTITDGASGSPRTISLNGTGVNPFPIVSLTPGNVTFGSVNLGVTSAQQTITLTNTGTANLTFGAPTASGDFAIASNNCVSPLVPNNACSFALTFKPTATGARTGTFTFTSNASTSPDHVNLSGTGLQNGPAVVFSPDNLSFASQPTGTTSAAQNISLSNPGNATLTFTSILASGDFAQTNNCGASIVAGGACTISVTFTPTASGNRGGLITVTDNATGSPHKASLAGVGAATPATATVSPNTLVFASQPVHVASAAQTVTLTNSGSAQLNISSIVATGDFSQTNNCSSVLPGSTSCSVSVTFTPTAAGSRTGTLTFTDNATNSPQAVSLSGTGVLAPLVTLSPTSLSFPNTNVGSSSATQSVTLTNTGTAALTITAIASVNIEFTQTNNCPASVAVNATCTITVTFKPDQFGGLGGNISITDNAYDSPQNVSLSGTGIGAGISLSPGSLTFANQAVGTTSAAQTVTLTSTGNVTLAISSIAVGANYLQTNNCPASLTSGLNCTISVSFKPTTANTLNGTLSVTDNAPGTPQTVALTGVGTGAVISLNPTSLTFAGQTTNTTSAPQNVTVTNTGNTNLTISNISSSDGEFASTNNCPTNIVPNTPCTIAVTFTPNSIGPHSATFTITDNAVGTPHTFTASGTGTGVAAVTLTPAAPLTFPGQSVNTTSATQNVTLTNSGGAPLTVTSVLISGDFADSQNCTGGAIPASGSCTITVSFTPTASGTRNGTLTFNDNASGSPQTYALTGTGIGVAGISFNPSSLTFASQTTNTTSTAKTITVTSNGSAVLNITGIVASGDFAQTNNCPTSMAVNATCIVSVTFTPTATGTRNGAVQFTDNAPLTPQSVSLTGTGASPTLVSISVTPASATIAKGTTQQFAATGHYNDNSTQNLTGSVNWSSSATATATINTAGLATGVAVGGPVTITATSNTISGTASLTVTNPNLLSIAVTPANASIAKGSTQQYTATGTYSDNSTQNITGSVVWSSSAAGVASISSGGLLTAVSAGPATITATSGTVNGSTPVTVTGPALASIAVTPANTSITKGTTQQYTATGTYTDSSTQNITGSVAWSTSNNAIATIIPTGVASAVAVGGPVTITATSGAITGTTSLTVTPATLSSITVSPAAATVASGQTQAFTATGHYSDSSTQNLTSTVALTSSNNSIATIASTGVATGVTQGGPVTITATSGSVSGTASLTVTQASLTSITVTPAAPSIAKGTTQQFSATGHYSDNSTQIITTSVTWTSSNSAIGNIASGTGLASGVAVGGPVTITATSGSISGTASLTVTPAALTSITVSPSAGTVAAGQTLAFTATGHYTDATTQNLTSTVNWTSSNTSDATIASNGVTTGIVTGTTVTITATSGAISGTASLTVTSATLSSITVTPASASIAKGTTQQFTATGHYTDNSTQNLTGSVIWSSSATATAAINTAGVATGVAVGGPVTITATSGSIAGTASLTVTSPTLLSIAVTPVSATIAKGTTQQYTATGTYTDNSTQNLTGSVIWSSSASGIATITTAGVATGVTAGGPVSITATSGTITGTASLTVTGPGLVSIAVTPSAPSIAKGTSQQFTATGHYTDNSTQNITASVNWTSSGTGIATINTAGLATGVAIGGPVTITAASGTITGIASLTVTSPTLVSIAVTPASATIVKGNTQQYTATGTYTDNSTQNITGSVIWSSSASGIATITTAGLATGVTAGGPVTITATSGAITGTASLTVTNATLSSITVTPASASIAKGTSQQFTATGHYTDNSTQNLTASVIWSSSALATATINTAGLATGVAVGGPVTITAISGNITGTASLSVTSPTLLSIAVTPSPSSIVAGTTEQYTATGTYSDSSTQNLTNAVVWTSSSPSIASISSTGLATGVLAGGPVTITAASGTISGTAPLTVTPVVLQNPVIAVNPLSLTFANQVIGTSSAAQSISVSNTGTAALAITSIALTGTNPAEYSQTNNCPIFPATLAPSGSCAIQVSFVPLAVGTRTANVTLTDNTNGVPGSQQNVTLTGTASAAPPTTSAPIPISFTPGVNQSQVATVNCPSGTSPCTDANAHSLKVAITQVNTPFTLTVTAHEVSLTEANGVCEAGKTETTDFDCRFTQYFSYQPQPNGDVIVPQCIPYSNGNCVYYTIGNVPPGSAITGPIFEYVAWNNSAFTPPAFYQTDNPRFFDDPDEAPYDVNHQFALDITDYFLGNGGHVGQDPGIAGHTKHFTDFVIAFPALLPNPAYTFSYVAPLGTPAATFTQGTPVPVKFSLLSGTNPITNAITPPNAVSIGVLNSAKVRMPAYAPDGSPATLTYDSVGQQYVLNLSTQGFAPGIYTFFANSNLFTQQTTTFTVTTVPLQIATTSPLASGTAGLVYSQAFAAFGGTAPYTWTLQSGVLPTGLMISSAGFLNGIPTAGTYNFTLQVTDAASASLTRAYSVVIKPAALVSIAVTPPNPSVFKGSTQQFVATGTFTDNSTQVLSSPIWTSSSTSVATISTTGLATGVAFGTTTITATQVSISGSTTMSVKILGDVNGDGVVDCADLAIVKASFGKKTGQPGFDPRADVNGDGVVNAIDLSIVSRQFPANTHCP
jgi:uncharacterized protein YjdB